MKRATGYLFLFAAGTTVLFSCKQEPVSQVSFTHITETDANGNLNGAVDSTDWTNDTVWNSTELALLTFADAGDTITDTLPGAVTVAPAYPNPSNGAFSLRITNAQQCVMKMAIVNTNYEILFYDNRIMWGGPFILHYDVSGFTAFRKPGYYRLYYGFFNAFDSLYYKGHGDLYFQ